MLNKIRILLISLLAGKSTVMINVKIIKYNGMAFDFRDGGNGLFKNVSVDNSSTVRPKID